MWEIETDLPIQLSAIHLDHVQVTATETAYLKLERCARSYQTRYADRAIGKIQGVQTARSLFRAIGVDPTKRRPSSEALLRRALKGKALYTVNSLVDVGNWCSLDFLLPVCIYDADRLNGDVVIRKGRENESYIGLNNHTIHLYDRYMLADETGGFGSPDHRLPADRRLVRHPAGRTGYLCAGGLSFGNTRRTGGLFCAAGHGSLRRGHRAAGNFRSAVRPRRCRTSRIRGGRMSRASPTIPKSAILKIGAAGSALIATMVSDDRMPTRCCTAPLIPTAT